MLRAASLPQLDRACFIVELYCSEFRDAFETLASMGSTCVLPYPAASVFATYYFRGGSYGAASISGMAFVTPSIPMFEIRVT